MEEMPREPGGWLARKELADIRSSLPLVYGEPTPVGSDATREATEVDLRTTAVAGAMSSLGFRCRLRGVLARIVVPSPG